ncbi:DUF3800 domain-containing protein [Cystobacter ferrugineus]|uniref:DUF3800 domain-containing protein n=1 Tax=Cystobacter ferrugineus TaxID=83449 RepID=A0A1L9AYS3_9BACT|nr:DUF3800 domain-containing protein [Cystobacter ferrugineus]OJH35154.1 hypothetical protein BON30_39520 [Cystobacter ferrugineus]
MRVNLTTANHVYNSLTDLPSTPNQDAAANAMKIDSPRSTGTDAARKHAFVDEYGDPSIQVEKDGVSTYYIVTAVLIDEENLEPARSEVSAIRARHFGKGEMKSSGVGRDDARRCRVLKELARLPFRFVSLVVDKRQVRKDSGLIFKQPFIKFVHRQLFEKLYRAHPDLVMLGDKHGHKKFMDGFEGYVRRNVEQDLFRRPTFSFGDSKEEPLLQLADFITGTIGRLYDPKRETAAAADFIELLRDNATLVLTWPPEDRPIASLGGGGTKADRAIREYCLRQVFGFLAKHSAPQCPSEAAQVAVAEHLLFHFQSISETEYVPTGRLREFLIERGIAKFEEQQQFRSGVIAKLRDQGIILASSSKGYKIPASVRDLMDFVERTDTVVHPMIGRLERARTSVRLLTDGAVDIIGDDRFEYLRVLLDRGPLTKRPAGSSEEGY